VEAKAKATAENEKELAKASRITSELAENEATDKATEEERKKKDARDTEGDTHPMELDVLGSSTAGTET
jgi:hypothetical protein